jgi:hypothetical protein
LSIRRFRVEYCGVAWEDAGIAFDETHTDDPGGRCTDAPTDPNPYRQGITGPSPVARRADNDRPRWTYSQ